MGEGWVRIYRKWTESSFSKDSEAVHLWLYLITRANHKDCIVKMGTHAIEVKRGSFVSGRKSISKETGIQESKVERLLSYFKTEHQIEQQTTNKYRLIHVINYEKYQDVEQQDEQQMNNKRTTNEQQMNTDNNAKNVKNEKNDNKRPKRGAVGEPDVVCLEVISYLNLKAGKHFNASSPSSASFVHGRISEGFTVEDFKKVIDIKVSKWKDDPKMDAFLRPQTLFSPSHFEAYLNENGGKVKMKGVDPDWVAAFEDFMKKKPDEARKRLETDSKVAAMYYAAHPELKPKE